MTSTHPSRKNGIDLSPDSARIHVIGMEPEGLSTQDIRFSRLFSHCRILCGGDRHLKTLTGSLPEPLETIMIRGKTAPLTDRLKLFLEESPAKGCAIVLASGDPLYHGIGSTLIREIDRRSLAFYPAPTLAQRAFALLGIPWEEASVVSFHKTGHSPALPDAAKKAPVLAFYTDGPKGPHTVWSVLNQTPGIAPRIRDMVVVENIGLPDQAICSIDPVRETTFEESRFATLNIVVVTLDPVTTIEPQENAS